MERLGNILKIKNIKINKLYGMYDYNIDFNEDITFLHGKNGCGKTTVLNIITYIITGEVYKLFDYDFKTIMLTYKKEKSNAKITIQKLNEDIKIEFDNKEEIIKKSAYLNIRDNNELRTTRQIEFFERYPILNNIRELFDFTYVPLNRNYDIKTRHYGFMRPRWRHMIDREERLQNGEPIYNIKELILNNYARIQTEISRLSKGLQPNIVKTMYLFKDIKKTRIDMSDINDKDAAKKAIDNFKKAGLYDDELGEQINNFYKKLKSVANKKDIDIDYIVNANKIYQLNDINNVFKDYDSKVEKLNEPITRLETIVNRFFEDSAERKKLVIKEDDIYFLTEEDNRKIEIYNLSSGEKQILILFTFLIFDIANKKDPIFIIDEPELSLHLLWQKNFVSSVLETNPNMQLILATHSPQIIDKYRDKEFKVELLKNK